MPKKRFQPYFRSSVPQSSRATGYFMDINLQQRHKSSQRSSTQFHQSNTRDVRQRFLLKTIKKTNSARAHQIADHKKTIPKKPTKRKTNYKVDFPDAYQKTKKLTHTTCAQDTKRHPSHTFRQQTKKNYKITTKGRQNAHKLPMKPKTKHTSNTKQHPPQTLNLNRVDTIKPSPLAKPIMIANCIKTNH